MSHVDDGQLHAFLDGELALLDTAEAKEVERHLAGCAECQARLTEERRLRERAHAILGDSGPVELSAPSFSTLAARRSASGAEPPRGRRRWRSAHTLAWAASLLLALGLGWFGRELLRQPAETHVAAESATPADRPAAAAADARGAVPRESEPLATAAPPAADARAETSPPAVAAPPAADVVTTETASIVAPDPANEAVAYGRVTNEAGVGIPDVTVHIPALNAGTLTRADGSYLLIIPVGNLAAPEELAITATRIGMRTDSQRLVLQPGQEVAANFELRPETVALEGIVVAGQARESRRDLAVAAAPAPPAAAEGEVRWEPIDRAEAERRLGGRLRLVPGLRLVGITAGLEDGEPVIRTVQQLEGGEWLELLQRRERPARENGFAQRAARARVEAAPAAPAPPQRDVDPADGLNSRVIQRDGFRITARAPVSPDSLQALLSQLR